MFRFLLPLFSLLASLAASIASTSSLTDMQIWKLTDGTLNARIVCLSSDKKTVLYAEADDIIKSMPLTKFDETASKTIISLDNEDKRTHLPSQSPSQNGRFDKMPEVWPPVPGKGWQLRNWDTKDRNSLTGVDPKDYGSDDKRNLEFHMSAALWWHKNFTFRHKDVKDHDKLIKKLHRSFKSSNLNTSDFIPEGDQASVMMNSYYEIKPSEFRQFMSGNCVVGVNIHPLEGSRVYGDGIYLIKPGNKKDELHIYYWGERLVGSFQLINAKKGELETYEFVYTDPESNPDWINDRKVTFRYQPTRNFLRTIIPVEQQIVGSKWKPLPSTKDLEQEEKPKPIAESVVLPDNEITFLETQRPLTMEITSTTGKSTTATLQKVEERQIKIRKRHSTHILALDTLNFDTQMKAQFWKANKGMKFKLPACRLNYKVRNKKTGSQYTFTICYDGKSQCYLTADGHKKEVYFNNENLTYSIYQSEKGRLQLVDKQTYNSESHLEYPTLARIGDNRKNYPATTASDTNGFANRVIMSKSTTIDNHRDATLLKAAHVEAQPVVQFIHGFSSIQIPSTQMISRANFSLVSAMRLLFENATLPMELHWKQLRSGGPDLMELTLEKISPLEENFFLQYEQIEAKQKAEEERIKAANQE